MKELEKSPRQEVRTALKTIGPEATPYLIELLHSEDTVFKSFLRENWMMIPNTIKNHLEYPTSSVKLKSIAFKGLKILGTNSLEVLPEIINALNDPNDSVKASSASTLKALGPQAAAAVPALLNALNYSTDMVRNGSEKALARIWKEASTEKLRTLIISRLESATEAVKLSLCRIYCKINTSPPQEIITTVSHLLETSKNRNLQEEAALLITDNAYDKNLKSEFSETQKYGALWLLRESRNQRIKRMANAQIRTLLETSASESQKPFMNWLKFRMEDPDHPLSDKLKIIDRIVQPKGSLLINQFPCVMELIKRELEDSNNLISTKLNIVNRIGIRGNDSAHQFPFVSSLLIQWLEEKPEDRLPARILYLLTRWGVSEQLDHDLKIIVDYLDHPNLHCRKNAARIIGKSGPKAMSFIPTLEKMMASKDPHNQIYAAEAILKIEPNHPGPFQVLKIQYQEGDTIRKRVAAWKIIRHQFKLDESLKLELSRYFQTLADDDPAKPYFLAAALILNPENKDAQASLLRLNKLPGSNFLHDETLWLLAQHKNLPSSTMNVLKQLSLDEEYSTYLDQLSRFH